MRCGAEVVGSRLAIRWCGDQGKPWYSGRVAEWQPCDGTHLIAYDDGDQKAHNLADEESDGQLRWETSGPREAGRSSSSKSTASESARSQRAKAKAKAVPVSKSDSSRSRGKSISTDAREDAQTGSQLLALHAEVLCLILDRLPDARPAWRLLSSCRAIRSDLSSLPPDARPVLQLGVPGWNGFIVSDRQATAVMRTGTCRVETAVIGRAARSTGYYPTVDLPHLLECGGCHLQCLRVENVTVDLYRNFAGQRPLRKLTLVNCSVGVQHANPQVLAGLRQLHSLEKLSLLTTDIGNLRGLASHPSLTSLSVGGEKWAVEDEDGEEEEDDDEDDGGGMPSLSGIYNIPKLAHLDLSDGLEQGSRTGGFKVTTDDYRRIGKCKALTTLIIPVCGDDDHRLRQLTLCPRLESIEIHMGRGWDEGDGESVSHDFLCRCAALKRVVSNHGWMDRDEGEFFRALARKLARSHPGLLVGLPRDANDYPAYYPGDLETVEEFLGEDEDDDEEE